MRYCPGWCWYGRCWHGRCCRGANDGAVLSVLWVYSRRHTATKWLLQRTLTSGQTSSWCWQISDLLQLLGCVDTYSDVDHFKCSWSTVRPPNVCSFANTCNSKTLIDRLNYCSTNIIINSIKVSLHRTHLALLTSQIFHRLLRHCQCLHWLASFALRTQNIESIPRLKVLRPNALLS